MTSVSESEIKIFSSEATKIASSPVIKNMEQIQKDLRFQPNWYRDLIREKPIYGIYKEFSVPE